MVSPYPLALSSEPAHLLEGANMSGREQSQRRTRRRDDRTEQSGDTVTGPNTKSDQTDGIDDLLDEIDQVLEENAEDFVRNYVQKGGQ